MVTVKQESLARPKRASRLKRPSRKKIKVMKTGRTIVEIATQIAEESKAKRDYVAPTTALAMTTLPAVAGQTAADVALQFSVGGQTQQYSPTNLCLGQIADRVGIPAKYAERMRTEAPELLCKNINHWFAAKPEKRMLRTLSNGHKIARAFLSERYRPLDNYDLFAAIVPKLQEAGCVIRSVEITETRFYIQASTPRIQRPINQTIMLAGGQQHIARIVEAGVIIGNSEVGCGAIFVDPMIYDNWCTNGAVMQRTLRRHHVGKRNEGTAFGDENTAELFSDATRLLDDKAFWSKAIDVVNAALSVTKFGEYVDKMIATQSQQLTSKPAEVVEIVADRFQLNDTEKDNVLMQFMSGGDMSKFGLVQAVTRAAQDVASYDRAVELERLGGQIIELPPTDFSAKN